MLLLLRGKICSPTLLLHSLFLICSHIMLLKKPQYAIYQCGIQAVSRQIISAYSMVRFPLSPF